MFSYEIPLKEKVETPFAVLCDISKFVNAAKKTAGQGDLQMIYTFTPTTLRLQGAVDDRITLSVNNIELTNPDLVELMSFYDNRSPAIKDKGVQLQLSPEFMTFSKKAMSFMGVNIKNNSIAVYPDHLIYADRTIIYRENGTANYGNSKLDFFSLHKNVLSLFEFLEQTDVVYYDEATRTVCWEHPYVKNFRFIIMVETCNISIPSDSDLEAITPDALRRTRLGIKVSKLKEAIEFFSGMYEASIWKPITFEWTDQKILNLKYQHPTTDINKVLDVEEIIEQTQPEIENAEFILISDALKTTIEPLSDDDQVTLEFNDAKPDEQNGAGVRFYLENSSGQRDLDVVFAKLTE